MSEYDFAFEIAEKVLADPSRDPDDDLATVARQFLRAEERSARLRAEKAELVETLAKIKDETLLGVSNGLGERIYALTCGALSRGQPDPHDSEGKTE